MSEDISKPRRTGFFGGLFKWIGILVVSIIVLAAVFGGGGDDDVDD